MSFTVTYPLFVLMDGPAPIAVDGMDGDRRMKALAVFTDKEAANQYREEHCPEAKLGQLPNETAFAKALATIRNLVSEIAFDPYRVGKRMQTISMEEMLRQLP